MGALRYTIASLCCGVSLSECCGDSLCTAGLICVSRGISVLGRGCASYGQSVQAGEGLYAMGACVLWR